MHATCPTHSTRLHSTAAQTILDSISLQLQTNSSHSTLFELRRAAWGYRFSRHWVWEWQWKSNILECEDTMFLRNVGKRLR